MQLQSDLDATSALPSPTHPSLMQTESPTPPSVHDDDTTQPTLPTHSGPQEFTAEAGVIPNTDGMAPVDFLPLMFNDHILNLIFMETSWYASQYLERER